MFRKINTKVNAIADHISRRFDKDSARDIFTKFGLHGMRQVSPKTTFFNLTSNW